jgi:hypothetical protein
MPNIVVYIKAADARSLQAEGKDVAEWVRAIVKFALEKRGG